LSRADEQYAAMALKVLSHGSYRGDRTKTGTISIFSHQMTFDMVDGFPLLTTKDMTKSFDHIVAEMLWMLKGSTNANELADMGFGIWRKWAKDGTGDLGPVYGHQWRHFNGFHSYEGGFGGVDQISWIMNELKINPQSRRMVVSSWNPSQLEEMALPPCHWSFELYVEGNRLNMKLHQRSCDVFLGVPYNIAEYALLLHMMSVVSGYVPGVLVHDMTNVHIYNNHIDQIREQVLRKPYPAPLLWVNREPESIFDFKADDFELAHYRHHPKLTGQVSV
jgi:thymidylate synthase